MSKAEIEAALMHYLGARKILWLPAGVEGDLDTNGHVDNMCCFLAPGVVALHWADRTEDSLQHARSQAAWECVPLF